MGTAYDAILFDNDGVLTTPTDRQVLRDAIETAFDRVGEPDPRAEHVQTLVSPTVDSLADVAAAYNVEPGTLWEARERAAIDAQLGELEAGRKRPYDDVDVLSSLETATGIVSNNQHETIENILSHTSIGEFDVWYGREPTIQGIERKKPRPYYLERAISDLGVSNPLYVGDSQKDVVAASTLGIDAAFVRRDHRRGYELSVSPTYEIESLEGLLEVL
ncbi:HAD family hydrolase [Natrarchaeobaculum aegyptiacum]|uniref:Hydrolase n=1 Tax=Natrarchaeobaculum aegyptiacum TaxID=745377 RepID=A0A2Z2HUD6_9EURY|nr:HAD-IA family hydrolase [Natrarchaeobaculum aegyptiacum]ARS90896.1 hydrolase [Natrarchaeobaculum aegyptiacum]